jgi:hypothetical protein
MSTKFKPDRVARSFAFGFISLIVSTSLVACGPGPEESAATDSHSFVQREPPFELASDDRDNGPIRSTQ